jgi:hypothetical protein
LRPIAISDITGQEVKAAKAFLKKHGGDEIRSLSEQRPRKEAFK